MQKIRVSAVFFLLSLSFLCMPAFADILPPNSHYVERCVRIANLDSYPSIVIITQDLNMGGDKQILSIAAAGECLPSPGYKFDPYKVYWAEKSYVDSIQLQNLTIKNGSYEESSLNDSSIHFITSTIRTGGGYVDNSNPATSEEIFYLIEPAASGQYNLVKQGASVETNRTTPSTPSVPSVPSKPARPLFSQSGIYSGDQFSYAYLLLVLVLGAIAIFILVKSMPRKPAAEQPQNEAPAQPYWPAAPKQAEPKPPAARRSGKHARKKKA